MSVNVLDIETYTNDEKKMIPYCICMIYDNISYSFWYEEKMIVKFIEKLCEVSTGNNVEIYSHNINFDGLIIVDWLKNKNVFFEWYVRKLNVYWIDIHYLKKKIRIRCSYKIIPISVKKMGEMMNIEKEIFPHRYVTAANLNYVGAWPSIEWFNDDDFQSLNEYDEHTKKTIFNLKQIATSYCMKDVKIVHLILTNVLKILWVYDKKIITNSFSFSSIAYKLYIKKYLNVEKLVLDKNDLFTHNYFKNAYYGGRCEVFGNPSGKKIIHHFDFSGMYGQCMLEKFPIGIPRFTKTNLNVGNIGFHTIKFKCDNYLPFLPYKSDKLLFPNGIMTCTFWYEEILNAIKYGKCEILNHYSSLVYEKDDYIFTEYVNDFNKLRKKGGYHKILGKNMINGLYGSFALDEENEITILCLNEIEFNSYLNLMNVSSWTKTGNIYIITVLKDERSKKFIDYRNVWDFGVKKRNIGIAAIISAKARIKLNTALEEVLLHKGELYYTDTDSIFAGFDDNRLNQEMGEIKWSEVYNDAVFVSSKFYYINQQKIVLKGIKSNTHSFEHIKKNFYENSTNPVFFPNQMNINKQKYELYQNYKTKKISLNVYDKRVFSFDKRKTQPIWVNNE